MLPSKIAALLEAARPKQWTKNVIVFAPMVFAQQATDKLVLFKVLGAFVTFCLLSSAVYLVNDVVDLEQDRHHPLKSLRPLAAGKLKRSEALLLAFVCLGAGMGSGFALNMHFGLVCIGYLALQFCYMFWLKHVVILDVLSIALGFVMRVLGGGAVSSIEISHWLLICTMLLALFLVVCKRRHELLLLGDVSVQHRRTLVNYNQPLLDQMVAVVTSSTLLAYVLYTFSPETMARFGGDQLKYTIPFVLYGIFRYLYLVYRKEEGGSPEGLLLDDKPLLINIVLYGLTAAGLLYWK